MPFRIRIIAPDDKIKKIDETANNLQRMLENAVERCVKNAEALSKKEYLTGPNYGNPPRINPTRTLGVRSGRLRSSVRGTLERGGTIIRGVLTSGPLSYARIHEFGGFAGKGKRVWLPERPYLRPALERAVVGLKEEIDKIMRTLS